MKNTRRKNIFIASEVRSGSTYIAESISYSFNKNFKFELWDLAQEKFSHVNMEMDPEEISIDCGSLFLDASGFSAAKIMCKEISIIYRHSQTNEKLRECFFGKDAYWIIVRRKDRIAQAVSLALARMSGLYHFYGDPSEAPDHQAGVGIEDISSALRAITLSDIFLGIFSEKLRPENSLEIFYEDFLKDEVLYLNKVARLCKFSKIDRNSYENGAKLIQTSQDKKFDMKGAYKDWLLKNYI